MRDEPRHPNLGGTKTFHLDNGVPLYVFENRAAPTVDIRVCVRTGSVHEEEFLGCGLSHFLEHMMFQGSKRYSAAEILDTVHSNGGEMNAYTSFDMTVYYMDLLSEAFGEALDMLADVIANPLFPAKSFKVEKDVILREKAMGTDDPENVLGERLRRALFTVHPARVPIIGESGLIETVDRGMMLEYFERRYALERIFFVVVGDVDAAEAADRLNAAFASFSRSRPVEPYLPEEPERAAASFESFSFDDPLARLAFGYLAPPMRSSDSHVLDMLSSVLAGGKSSRLVRRLRDEREMALNVDAYNYAASFGGMFTVYASCVPEKAGELRGALLAEIADAADTLDERELERVRRQDVASFHRGLRSNAGIARILTDSIAYRGDPDYLSKYLDAVSRVDVSTARSVAGRLLAEDRLAAVSMLPKDAAPVAVAASVTSRSPVSEGPGLTALPERPRLVSFRDDSSPLVDVVFIMPGGTIFEGIERSGSTRLVSVLLKAGAGDMDEKELAEFLDDNAISLAVSSGNNTLLVRMNCLEESLPRAVEALRSMLSAPAFPEAQFERERARALESLKARGMSPQRMAEDAFRRLLFGKHPYSCSPAGTEESIASMTLEDLRSFFRDVVLDRDRTVVGVSGPLDRSKALSIMEEITSAIPWTKEPRGLDASLPRFPNKPKHADVALPKEQSVVMLGVPGCSNTHRDRFSLDVLQTALNGLETRLFKAIRGDAGLAYYTGLYSSRGLHPGFLAFYAGTAPESVERVVSIIRREKAKLVSGGLTAKEFDSAVARLRGDVASAKLDPGRVVAECALSEYYGNPHDEPWRGDEVFSSLSRKKVNAAIAKYLSRKGVVSAVAGPKKR